VIKLIPDNESNRLQDNVILIINGLSESGRVLADMLAKQGADVAIVDSEQKPELAHRIRRDVKANARRCLILTPDSPAVEKKSFSQYAIQKIIDTFGRLDAFISYSGVDSARLNDLAHPNGRLSKPILFDQGGLTKAALRHILTDTHV
jgi:NAD(P)-dependent dehydrogenase (short-subunit alcohol dehydrogenase family)